MAEEPSGRDEQAAPEENIGESSARGQRKTGEREPQQKADEEAEELRWNDEVQKQRRVLLELKRDRDKFVAHRRTHRSELQTDGESHPEAEKFRKKLTNIMCEENNDEALERFMANSDGHPRFVWRDLLLSSPSKNKSRKDDLDAAFSSLTWSRLMEYFPDIIQRELFLDDLEAIFSKKKCEDRFGVLHAAVLCGRPQIVDLLRDHRKNAHLVADGICRRLEDFALKKSSSGDCFYSIKRALLWTHFPNLSEYDTLLAMLTDFAEAKDSNEGIHLGALIEISLESNEIEENTTLRLWKVILKWASEVGRGDLVKVFRKLARPTSSTLHTKLLDWVDSQKLKTEKTPLNDSFDVRNIIVLVRSVVEDPYQFNGSKLANCEPLMRLCMAYSLSCRVPMLPDAQIDIPYTTRNSRWTALHLGAALGDLALVDALIASYEVVLQTLSAAQLEVQSNPSRSKTVQSLLDESFRDTLLMTPLHHAVLGNHHQVVKSMSEWRFFQPHLNDFDIFKRTALQIACSNNAPISILNTLTLKTDPNITDCCGFTPLHWAVYVGATEVVRFLVFKANEWKIRAMVKSIEGQHPYRVADDLNPVELKKELQDLLESIPEVKDSVERAYRDRQVYVDAANAVLVGAALIASVTFGGWLQPPLGNENNGTPMYLHVFWAMNSLSFFFAIGTVIAGAEALLPQAHVHLEDAVENIRKWLVGTAFLFICSILFVLIAFSAAGFETLSQAPHLKANMISTTAIGGAVCIGLVISFCQRFFRILLLYHKEFTVLEWLRAGACKVHSYVSKLVRLDVRVPSKKPIAGNDSGKDIDSLEKLRKSIKELVVLVKHDHSRKLDEPTMTEYLHRASGLKICPIRRCSCLIQAKNDHGWSNETFCPENTKMWKSMRESIVNSIMKKGSNATTQNSLFHDAKGGLTYRGFTYRTNDFLKNYGVVTVDNEDTELLRRYFKSQERSAEKRGDSDGQRQGAEEKVVLKVPICCAECVESIGDALLALKGVKSVECNIPTEKVTVMATSEAAPSDILLASRRIFRKSELYCKYDRTGALEDLKEAIHGTEEAVKLMLPDDPRRTEMRELDNILGRYGRTGALEDLQAAIYNIDGAIKLRTGALEDLRAAIYNNQEDIKSRRGALAEEIRREHPNRAMSLSFLGSSLDERHGRTGALEDPSETFCNHPEAVKLITHLDGI